MKRKAVVLVLMLGIVQISCYWISGLMAGFDGSLAIPQPDTLLYCQAARRIAEGAPFSFSLGTGPSTGTTSVLYPFILSVPYLLGFSGDSLLSAGFLINALFYLAFLACVTLVILRVIPDQRTQIFSLALLGLAGHPAYSALAQSDIGFLLFWSAMTLAALAYERSLLFAFLLVAFPWVRPEGVICAAAYFFTRAALRRWTKGDCLLLLCFVLSVLGVGALNYWLTGSPHFASISHKGYFKTHSFPAAVFRTARDGLVILREFVFCFVQDLPRALLSVPLLGGVLFFFGALRHQWKGAHAQLNLYWVITLVLGVLSVAQSGWQGTNMDRYLAWITPLVIVLTAEGVCSIVEFDRVPWLLKWVPHAVLFYAVCANVVYCCIFYSSSQDSNRMRLFAENCERIIPSNASIGANGDCGIAYFLSSRRVAHLCGMYSPEFDYMTLEERMDDIKRNPGKRFDYWLLNGEYPELRKSDLCESVFGPCVMMGHGSRALYRADWSAFDAADVMPIVSSNERLVARVDVGYPPDERASRYEIIDRYARPAADTVFHCQKRTDGTLLADAGRLIVGGDSMSVPLCPGKDVRVVMRVASSAEGGIAGEFFPTRIKGNIPSSFAMNVSVDGEIVECVNLSCEKDGFTDVSFNIPGSAIKQRMSRIAFLGDHIPFGYWFFQEGIE